MEQSSSSMAGKLIFPAKTNLQTADKTYYNNCRKFEDFAVQYVSEQHLPVLNQFSRIDNPFNLTRMVNAIKAKRIFKQDLDAQIIYLTGISDLLVCSSLNCHLITIFEKSKDNKEKIREHFDILQEIWNEFFISSFKQMSVDQLVCIINIFDRWIKMLKNTNFQGCFDEAFFMAEDALMKLLFIEEDLKKRKEIITKEIKAAGDVSRQESCTEAEYKTSLNLVKSAFEALDENLDKSATSNLTKSTQKKKHSIWDYCKSENSTSSSIDEDEKWVNDYYKQKTWLAAEKKKHSIWDYCKSENSTSSSSDEDEKWADDYKQKTWLAAEKKKSYIWCDYNQDTRKTNLSTEKNEKFTWSDKNRNTTKTNTSVQRNSPPAKKMKMNNDLRKYFQVSAKTQVADPSTDKTDKTDKTDNLNLSAKTVLRDVVNYVHMKKDNKPNSEKIFADDIDSTA